MKPRKMPFAEFKSIYSRVPRLCVEVIIKTKEGIVLTKRTIEPEKGKWHTPGGTVLKGEKLADTVIRVAREETGLVVKPHRLLGVLEFSFPGYFSQPIALAYEVVKISGKLKNDSHSDSIRFFKKIPKNTIHEHKLLLKKHYGLEVSGAIV